MSTPSRQLAAIMFTDIVGYTALMGNDEQKAFTILTKNRELQKPIINQFNGRWIKELGDGVMASFNTVSDAVNAAIKIQEACNAAKDFQLRIGIHLGEVIFENDDVFGDGVNMASRIQGITIPGGIFISESVFQNISNKKEIQTISLGKYNLKNIKEQVEIYAIKNPGIKIPETHNPENTTQIKKLKCILVLPFVNMSNDPEQEYFNDGLTEELIANLSKLKEVKVISRTTSMKYKNTTKNIRTIGKETGASYIMEGSVRKHGNNLRITAQFVDADQDFHLWAENYRGTIDDIFDIQEQVSTKIVEALRIELTHKEIDTLQKRSTQSTEAYQLYLQGRYFWNIRNEEALDKALTCFKKAIEIDPDYAVAWAGIADTYNLLCEFTNYSRRESSPKAKLAVEKALELDNQLAEAHISLGLLLMLNEWDWVNAGKEYKLGIELNPGYATGHHWYAEWLLFTGKQQEALHEISIAVDLDPVSHGIIKDQGMTFYYTRQYDKAISMALKALDLAPEFASAFRLLSLAYMAKGMFNQAISENQHWGTHTGNKVKTDVALSTIYASAGLKEDALKLIEKVKTDNLIAYNDYRGIALTYAALSMNDDAFSWLEKSFEHHEESLCSIKVDPKMDNLRADPRFNVLLKKIGLEN